ncbi:LOW QUALITY PROTEIN: paired amphipathic helix protein Sin3b [Pholidichthys leucotaenia]
MAKIQAHSTAKQLNQIQDKPYVITQKQVQQQHFQKLKVEDALSYLDQVKIRFANDPGIYNKFLDIMKEFKSQSIDTPGVINRVSQLFHGHPDLVLGFNAFLPPGYRIEVPKNGMAFLQSPFSTQVSPGQQGKSLNSPPVTMASSSAPAVHTKAGPAQTSEVKVASSEPLSLSTSTGPSDPTNRLSLPLTSREGQSEATSSSLSPPSLETSPVEFDSAISYVNKIKNRFLDNPEIYRSFLEILHTYQKEQLEVKESRGGRGSSGMTEDEVFSKVASLFKGQEDLLAEFGQFLPDAKRSLFTGSSLTGGKEQLKRPEDEDTIAKQNKKRPRPILLQHMSPLLKKKMKYSCTKDQSFASVGKHGVLREFSFFDKVRRLFKSQEVYENFLRCIALFNQEVVSGAELLQLVTPFLGKFPELYSQFKSFLGDKELSHAVSGLSDRYMEGGGGREVDYASCKRLGSSYRALPKTYQQPKCSGRTALCKEVLNDTWVSFPSWSEDSTFVSSKKTPYEEQLHRCEDERFELDVVLETNLATIRLESVQKKLSRLSPEDQDRFRLDDCLGGTSEVIQRRAVYRIYGDKAPEIIEGAQEESLTAVPVVLKRLKAKEEEWREAQQGFNKIWRGVSMRKAYLKSLDHQGVTSEQNDMSPCGQKSLLNIESIYDERQEQSTEEGGVGQQSHNGSGSASSSEPHMVFTYEDKQILEDAASLIIYHVKRQPTIHKDDKDHIKRIIQHFVPDLFFSRRGELSDTEEWTDEEAEPEGGGERGVGAGAPTPAIGGNGNSNNASGSASAAITGCQSQPQPAQSQSQTQSQSQPQQQLNGDSRRRRCSPSQPADTEASATSSSISQPAGTTTPTPGSTPMEMSSSVTGEKVDLRDPEAEHQKELDDVYNLFFVNNNWYFFLRLHQTLCSRLLRVYRQAERQLLEHRAEQSRERLLMIEGRREKACDLAMELRLKQPSEVELEEYYPAFLDMVRSLLDGNLDSTQYEDTLREMFTIHAYIGFTIDKVIHNIIRQLQHLVSDEVCLQVVDLYLAERKRGAAGGNLSSQCVRAAWETSYQWKAERVMAEENCFKVMFIQNKGHVTMTIELLDTEEAQADDPMDVQCLSSYMEQFVGTESSLCSQAEGYFFKPVFLPRNLRRFRRWQVRQVEAMRCRREWHRQLGVENAGSLDCRFKLNTHKMVFVMNSEDYMYRRGGLVKARKSQHRVTVSQKKRFNKWHQSWLANHVTASAKSSVQNWLMGEEEEDIIPCKTTCLSSEMKGQTVNKYKVHYSSSKAPSSP